jgi:DNA-binding PadR family transcriptional regulator
VGVQQEVVLAMLAKEPSHGYQLRARLQEALGPAGGAMNAGQIYVTLSRLERAGLVASEQAPARTARTARTVPTVRPPRPERKLYALTPAGKERTAGWLTDVSWPGPGLAEFHLKLIAAAAGRLAYPVAIIEAQRGELLQRLHDAQRAAMTLPAGPGAGLLLEGIVLRLQADLRWLEVCERNWAGWKNRSG